MKKIILKILFLGGVFILCLEFIQHILVMTRGEIRDLRKIESIYRRNTKKIDVCMIGSSPVYAGISPMILWNKAGITSVNLGISEQTAILSYFQAKNFIDIYLPKLIIIDLCSLFDARKADEKQYQNTYYIVVNSMRNKKNKFELIEAICKENDKQEILYYIFPFFRYHSQWGQIRLNQIWDSYPKYFRGGLLNRSCYSSLNIPEQYIEKMTVGEVDQYSQYYYEKLFLLCQKNRVQVMAVNIPKNEITWIGERIKKCKEICGKNDVKFVDFNSEENVTKLNLIRTEDFYNQGHLNARGNFKFSKVLGQKIKELYNLEDHRNDPKYANWHRDYDEFYKDYKDIFESIGE